MKLGIFGYGGHAREVAAQINKPVTFFVDDEYVCENAQPLSNFDPTKYCLLVSVSDPTKRKKIVERLPKETLFCSFIHPTALILDKKIIIGEGSFIGAYCVLTTNITVGKHTILNRGNHIGHDCVIGDYFSAMPGSIISGNVIIGNNVYFGSNSSVKEKIQICSDVKIGSNSTVVNNILISGVYVGVPSKYKKKS